MTMQPQQRRCSAIRCAERISSHLLMCKPHWSQVPHPLQAEVYRTLREWKAGGDARPYTLAVLRAQLVIVKAESLPYEGAIQDRIDSLLKGESH